MASITFTVPILKSYRDKKVIGVNEYLFYLLVGNRPAGTASQVVNADTYYSSYGIDNQTFATALQALARLKFLTYTIQQVSIVWSNASAMADMSETTLRSRWGKSLDDKTYYLAQILLNSKTAGVATQVINPEAIASNWSISTGEIMTELNTLLTRKEITSIDLGNLTITWLIDDYGLTRTEAQTMVATAKGLGSATHNALMALLHTKGAAALQTVNANTIYTNWKIDNTKLFSDIQTLKKAGILSETDSTLTLTFPAAVTTTMTETELKAEMDTLSANDYTWLAIKREYTDAAPANRRLVLTPTAFETEWGVKSDALTSAARTLANAKKFDIDLTNLDITWLIAPAAGASMTITPSVASISANTAIQMVLDGLSGAITYQWLKNGSLAGSAFNNDAGLFKPLNVTASAFSDVNSFGTAAGAGEWWLRITQGTTVIESNHLILGN